VDQNEIGLTNRSADLQFPKQSNKSKFTKYRSFYLPTDTQGSCFKNIKIYIKTVPTYFGLIAINQGAHYLSHTTELTTPMYFN
jgi:hypothetical protein